MGTDTFGYKENISIHLSMGWGACADTWQSSFIFKSWHDSFTKLLMFKGMSTISLIHFWIISQKMNNCMDISSNTEQHHTPHFQLCNEFMGRGQATESAKSIRHRDRPISLPVTFICEKLNGEVYRNTEWATAGHWKHYCCHF